MTEDAKPKKLTPNDPVDAATLGQFGKLESARVDIALRLLDIEQDKVRLLSAAHAVDQQTKLMFERVLVERGLPPQSSIDIDPVTGQVKVRPPMPEAASPSPS